MDTPKEVSAGMADLQGLGSPKPERADNDSASTADDNSRASSHSRHDGEDEGEDKGEDIQGLA